MRSHPQANHFTTVVGQLCAAPTDWVEHHCLYPKMTLTSRQSRTTLNALDVPSGMYPNTCASCCF